MSSTASRRRLVRTGLLLLVAAITGAVIWLVWFSSVLSVREVRATGVEDPRAAEVLAAAAVPTGVPLARVDSAAAEQRVRDLPWVRTVEVRRGWPSEVVVAVSTREPVAVLGSDPRGTAIDSEGVVFAATDLPKGLPRVTADGPALRQAVRVLTGLPEDLARRVVGVAATTRDDIDLTLRSGDIVRWGSAEQGENKAEVLRALLKRKADLYDVSAPELPTTFKLQ
jgi:cell division protein FtsQ